MVDHRLLCRLVDFGERADRELQIRGHSGADNPHHFVCARPLREIPADRGQKLQVQLRLSALRYVARDREQPRRLGIQPENWRNRDVPPLGFTSQSAEETHESCGLTCCRRLDRRTRGLTVLAAPELNPGGVQEGPDIVDAQQFLTTLNR